MAHVESAVVQHQRDSSVHRVREWRSRLVCEMLEEEHRLAIRIDDLTVLRQKVRLPAAPKERLWVIVMPQRRAVGSVFRWHVFVKERSHSPS